MLSGETRIHRQRAVAVGSVAGGADLLGDGLSLGGVAVISRDRRGDGYGRDHGRRDETIHEYSLDFVPSPWRALVPVRDAILA